MKKKRVLSLLLAAVVLAGLLPAASAPVRAADTGYQEVYLGDGRIGNGSYGATNLAGNFIRNGRRNTIAGFSTYETSVANNGNKQWHYTGDSEVRLWGWGTELHLTMDTSNNALLTALAKSTTAYFKITVSASQSDKDYHIAKAHYDIERIWAEVYVNGDNKGRIASNNSGSYEGSLHNVNTVMIKLHVYGNHGEDFSTIGAKNKDEDWAKANINFTIWDNSNPTLSGYDWSYDTNKSRENTADGKKELLVKLGVSDKPDDPEKRYYAFKDYATDSTAMASREWVDQNFTFSKPVTLGTPNGSGGLTSAVDADYQAIASHTLFNNTLGTGYQGQGEERGLVLKQSLSDISTFQPSLSYRYTATYGDYNGNNAIDKGGGITVANSYGASLIDKLGAAGLHDAAGNPLQTSGASGRNIFDKNNGGYDVIVDAVPPTYSRVGNGVTPDILTQLVLNKNDTVDFIVSFSEATITRRDWNNANTYLMLDNGDRAYFREKSTDGKQWIFRYTFQSGEAEEASLLKVIGLSNDALDGSLSTDTGGGAGSKSNNANRTFNADGRTITDYVGNVMVERANEDSSTNTSQIESSTGWAGLAVDNTPPEITFNYNVYGTGALTTGTDTTWGQAAKVMTSADDPDVPVAPYDPDYAAGQNETRPSKGVYRPDNTTGSTASAVGLIFYIWTRNVKAPGTGDNFEAIKRFSLTGEQPRSVSRPYADDWKKETYDLVMANNFSDIVPPDEAMTSAGDGAWYLHVWTADMTWDSARQLMQYQNAAKMQYKDGYNAAKFLALMQSETEKARAGSVPTEAQAWDAVKVKFYEDVYTAAFLERLKDGGKIQYTDAALTNALAAAESGVSMYQSGYDAELDRTDKKTKLIADWHTAHPSTVTAAAAWEAVQLEVYKAVFTEAFANWLISTETEFDTTKADEIALEYAVQLIQYRTAEIDGEDEGSKVTTQYDAGTAATLKENLIEDKVKADRKAAGKEGDALEAEITAAERTAAETAIESTYKQEVFKLYSERFQGWMEEATTVNSEGKKQTEVAEGTAWTAITTDKFSAQALAYARGKANAEATKNSTTPTVPYLTGKTAASFTSEKTAKIAEYQSDNGYSDDEAWDGVYTETVSEPDAEGAVTVTSTLSIAGVKEEYYRAVYSAYVFALLHDTYTDAAVTAAQAELVRRSIYKDDYNAAKAAREKQQRISDYRLNGTTDSTSGSTSGGAMTYEAAKKIIRGEVYRAAYTDQFLLWLWQQKNPNSTEIDYTRDDIYTDDAMVYARTQAMLEVADYANTEVWDLAEFTHDDSNWTVSTTRLLLDNTSPDAGAGFAKDAVTGENTSAVTMPVTVSDALSGIDESELYYQWVKKNADDTQTYSEVEWLQAVPDPDAAVPVGNALSDGMASPVYGKASTTFIATTVGNVIEDGDYVLYVKYQDMAGNVTIDDSGALAVTVKLSSTITQGFGPTEALTGYHRDVTPTLRLTQITVQKVRWLVSDQLERPDDTDAGYTEIAFDTAQSQPEKMSYFYQLPALGAELADGTWYLHVLVYEAVGSGTTTYYYRQAYQLDRTAPEIYINPDGFTEPQSSMEVRVSATDNLAGVDSGKSVYQVSASSEPIAAGAPGWLALPSDGMVTLKQETGGTYFLHVMITDKAGNSTSSVSQGFVLRVNTLADLPPYSCQLLTTFTDETGSYAVAYLNLEAADKAGYRYSLTTNGSGEKPLWCDWLPYMSIIRIPLPAAYSAADLQVKFRGPDGNVGANRVISTRTVSSPIWATAEFDSMTKRQSAAKVGEAGVRPLTLLMTAPEGVTVTEQVPAGAAARTEKLADGSFTVTANGVYDFTLTRGTQTASSPLSIVVDIFDDTPPVCSVSYSEVAPTNANVLATVSADEPVYVKALTVQYADEAKSRTVSPKFQFSFEKNGSAAFVLADEAGNEATVTATVNNIDKTPPSVRVDPNYDLYETVPKRVDNAPVQNPTVASGATLEANKDGSGKDFTVVNNDQNRTMEISENGEYQFIVQDNLGNVGVAKYTASNLVTALPKHTVAYQYVNADGTPGDAVREGRWKTGKVMVTLTFEEPVAGMALYNGTEPYTGTGSVIVTGTDGMMRVEKQTITNMLLKDSTGKYTLTRIYAANGTAVIPVCDDLGNLEKIPVTITGLDNTPPTLTLERETVIIDSGKYKTGNETRTLFDLRSIVGTDEWNQVFGAYDITDNVYSKSEDFNVSVARSDDTSKTDESDKGRLDEVGKFTLVYTVRDPAGNESYTEQTLIVIPADGLLIEANGVLLSSLSSYASILSDNHVTFKIDKTRMQNMFYSDGTRDEAGNYNSEKVQNSKMRYDIYYVSGLYREGQLKTIATRLTSEELTKKEFKVTFPKAGWYTIIIRNQERSREYTTFFISS